MKKNDEMPKFMGHYFEQGSHYSYSLMREESITIVFTDTEEIQIPLGTKYTLGSIEGLPGSAAGTYILLTPPSIEIDEATGGRTHTVTLDKEYWALQDFIFKFYTKYKATAEKPAYAKKEASWSLTAHIGTFAKVLKDNLADAGCGITDVHVDSVGTGGAQSLSFSSTSIMDAINKIASQWKCEWWVDGSVLHFGKCTKGTAAGFNEHVESSDPVAGVVTPNKWYVFGSTRNIPYWYKKDVNTDGVDLTFDNYRHELDGECQLTPFGHEGKQSLVGEGDHTTFIDYGMKTSVTPNTYVWIDFSGCTADYARSAAFNGEVYAYLQYSGDNKEYITMQRMKVSDVVGDTAFTKTKTYFKAETGMVYLRMLIELHTDEDNEKGYINISPTFAPKVYKVKNTGLKLGTLPMSCFESAELGDDSLSSAVVQNRLMLENAIDLSDGGMIREGVVVFDDIYPKSIHSVELLDSKEYVEEVELADGTKEKRPWRAYRMKAPSFLTIDDIISGKTLAVHFETGPLAGMEFDVSLSKDQYEDGVLEIIRNDKYGRWLPDATLYPQGTYALLNFDVSSGVGEIMEDAEKELLKAAEDYISTINETGDNRECTMMVDIETAYEVGDAAGEGRIVSLEIPLDLPYDHPKYTIGNSADYSRFGELKTQIEGATKDGSDYTGGATIYVIRKNDSTDPTNDNVYSAKRSDENYLSKVADDSVKGYVAFAKGLSSMGIISGVDKIITMKSFESGDYKRLEKGFYLGPELIPEKAQKQESRLEVDNLYVRNAIQYKQLNVKRRTYIGGSLVITCGSAEIIEAWTKADAQDRITAIEEELTILGNETEFEINRKKELNKELEKLSAIPDGVSRCWFLSEQDGMKINNEFVPGDFACNETLNLKEQSYYWRKVVSTGTDWVDLSLTEYDESRENNEPQAGDVIVQLGNDRDKKRQNAIFEIADTPDAPAILTYHGIDTFSLSDHEAILQKYDPTTGRMKLTVYGDCYVGDKDGSNYLSFDKEHGLSVMANNISFKTGEGTSDSVLNSFAGIKNDISKVKEQTDQNYTIWFSEETEEPTNDNYPAKDWTTDDEKVKHNQDILYNRFLGLAYRYIDGEWQPIADQDTIAALQQVKEKRRVFVSDNQPTPPYEIGDLWADAYYKDGTHNYDGDLLRCRVSRKEGETFDINDWTGALFMTRSVFEQNNERIRMAIEGVSISDAEKQTLKAEIEASVKDGMAEVVSKAEGTLQLTEQAIKDIKEAQRIVEEAGGDIQAALTAANSAAEQSAQAEETAARAEQSAQTNSEWIKGNETIIQNAIAEVVTTSNIEQAKIEQLVGFTETDSDGNVKSAKVRIEELTNAGLASISQSVEHILKDEDGLVSEVTSQLNQYATDAKAQADLAASAKNEAEGYSSAAGVSVTAANTAKNAAEKAQGNAEQAVKDAKQVLSEAKLWASSDGTAASIIAKVVKDNEDVRSEIEAVADAMTFSASNIDFDLPNNKDITFASYGDNSGMKVYDSTTNFGYSLYGFDGAIMLGEDLWHIGTYKSDGWAVLNGEGNVAYLKNNNLHIPGEISSKSISVTDGDIKVTKGLTDNYNAVLTPTTAQRIKYIKCVLSLPDDAADHTDTLYIVT